MPRPPIIPTVDWKSILDTAATYEAWLRDGEIPENCQKIDQQRKAFTLEPHIEGWLGGVSRPVYVLAFAEDWCGDVIRHVPVLQKLADFCPKLTVRYTTRPQQPELFARFLTNGGEAVPKFVFLNESYVETGNWGPMPDECRELIARGKGCGDVGKARQKVAALYELDASRRVVVRELLRLIENASCLEP